MPVEVERDQGEVSVKVVDMENATENKHEEEEAPASKEDVGNGINGNEKEDTDGSYVFVTENDTVGDDGSVKPVDDVDDVEKDLKEGEVVNPVEEKAIHVPDEVVEIQKSEAEDPLEKSVDQQNLGGNGNLDGKVESIEEVEQKQDSDVGSRDLPENNAEDLADLQGKIESEIKADVEGHQGDMTAAREKSDLDVDVSEDLQRNEDVAKPSLVDSDVGSESKVSPNEPNDGLEQPTLTDPADTVTGSETVDDRTGSESVEVLEPVSAENGHPQLEPEVEKTGDVPFTSEAEKVNGSDSDVLPDSGTVEVGVSEVSSDALTESQTPGDVSLESHTSGKDGVVENGNSNPESEAIQDSDFVGNSKVQSEAGAVDASVSDESMTTHQESQDASEPACDQDGKQQVAPEVTEVPDAPASEESSDAVIVSRDSVLVAPISDDVSCTNQQESERGEISGIVEKLPSHELHEDATSGNNPSVNLNDDTTGQEDHRVDTNQKIEDDCSAQSEEVTDVPENHAPVDKVHENNSEGNLNIGGDVCLTSSEEAKELPTEGLSGNESADTISTKINGSSSLLDSKTSEEGPVGETGAVATKSEAAEPVKESTEPHVVAPVIQFGEINREVLCGSKVNVTIPVDVSGDKPSEEVPEIKDADIKDISAMKTDEEVDSNTESLDSTKAPLDNNDLAKVSTEEDSREGKNETDGAAASVASETKTCAQDLESKVVTSTDTIHTEATDCADSNHVEIKEDAAKTNDKVEGSALDASEGHTVAAEIERRPFYFLPRVPRYDDEKLAEQLKQAEAQVEQKTQSRDALREDIQKIRATCKDYDISYKAAMAEERSARKAMHSKRQEIDALQSVISRVKSAASVDDIDSKVNNMEHMIQHETLSLSEEKGYIREIKQLKQLRGQISSSMGTKDEVKQALDDKEKTEERLKMLRKELDVLRNDLSKVEAVTKAAKKKCDEEWEVQNKLQQQFRAADAVRQEAFVHLQDLKKQQREKNKYFFKYRDDSRAANEMALKKDRAALQSLCSDQVENFMNMWNNNEEFRSYYVRCNTRSTLRRLGTLDGRSLGPDEEPPRITYAARTDKFRTVSNRAEKHETAPPVVAKQEKVVKFEGSKVENGGKDVPNPAEQKSQNTKPKKAVKPVQPPPPIVKESVTAKEEIEKSATKEEVEEETPKLTKEEEEQIKKEEEKRKQKEAAKMKEQHRLEEIAKAKEAMERKKKREEKAKARAALKAQKEAEEKEKEREKKLRKKERRKGVITSEETAENPTETSEAVIETPREIENPKKQTAEESQQIKKSHKASSQFLKQNKSKSIPLPLRNRGSRKKLKQWMWIGLVVLVALALFLLGNANLSFSPENLWFI
ncbi:Calponin-like domain protein [Hirschfeldia incana]|nr:Calponin-like domain protein [Hirschfeldia incana]